MSTKIRMFVIYDHKAEVFATPFFQRTRAEALRGFIEVCNDKTTNFYKWPSDYSLYEVGEFDLDSGELGIVEKRSLGTALDFKREEPPIQMAAIGGGKQ